MSFTPCFSRIDGPVKEIPILRALDRFPAARQAADGYFSEEEPRAPRECQCEWKFEVRVLYVEYAAATRSALLPRAAGIRESHVRGDLAIGMHCVEVRTSDENRVSAFLSNERKIREEFDGRD